MSIPRKFIYEHEIEEIRNVAREIKLAKNERFVLDEALEFNKDEKKQLNLIRLRLNNFNKHALEAEKAIKEEQLKIATEHIDEMAQIVQIFLSVERVLFNFNKKMARAEEYFGQVAMKMGVDLRNIESRLYKLNIMFEKFDRASIKSEK